MNRRQAKKAFKKKYGVNPEQALKTIQEAVRIITDENFVKNLTDLMKRVLVEAAEIRKQLEQGIE